MTKRLKFNWNVAVVFAIILLSFMSCNSLPIEKFKQAELEFDYEIIRDSLLVKVVNILHCPVLVDVISAEPEIDEKLNKYFPKYLEHKEKYTTSYVFDPKIKDPQLRYVFSLGNSNLEVELKDIELPFRKGKKYKIIQAFNGSYSHKSDYSKYAIDFSLKSGDTICAVANGYIVGVIKDYKNGGSNRKWRDYANFITIYHPESNFFTQYVHLEHEGALVKVGDFVQGGQVIGLSGKTGWTDIEHLHFNALKRVQNGMVSMPIIFKEGYKGSALKRGDVVMK